MDLGNDGSRQIHYMEKKREEENTIMLQDCLKCGHIFEVSDNVWQLLACPNCNAVIFHYGIQHPLNKEIIINKIFQGGNRYAIHNSGR
jgi:DNA-directed RNA polymerase subunit RPC12/RpoP